MWDSYLNANYNSLQLAINRSFSKGLALKGAYTYLQGHQHDRRRRLGRCDLELRSVLHRNRARAAYDQTHMFQMGFVYELPMGPGKNIASSGLASQILGGWQVSGILASYTGRVFTVGASSSSLNSAGNSQTADQVGQVTKIGGFGPGQVYYDPSAFESGQRPSFRHDGKEHPQQSWRWKLWI